MAETVRIAIAEAALSDIESLRTQLGDGVEFIVGPIATPEQVARLTEYADAIVVSLQPLRAEHIAALSERVRIISRAGVGLDTIDLAAAKSRDIKVVYQPNYATNEVADQAASLALASWRRLGNADALVRSGWGTSGQVGAVHALQESTLGVLGTGRIGRAFINRLQPFVKRVVVFDAYPDKTMDGVEWAETVEELLGQADLLSLHLPLTDSTRHVIDAAAIERMPNGAVLVNVSRGGLLDEQAVADALTSGKLSAAGLDVFEQEPLQADSPLRSAPNLLLSPHVAWYSVESGIRLASWSVEDVIAYLSENNLKNGSWAW
jgi:D-3-phosphoglycerate dehydrogenase